VRATKAAKRLRDSIFHRLIHRDKLMTTTARDRAHQRARIPSRTLSRYASARVEAASLRNYVVRGTSASRRRDAPTARGTSFARRRFAARTIPRIRENLSLLGNGTGRRARNALAAKRQQSLRNTRQRAICRRPRTDRADRRRRKHRRPFARRRRR